MTHNISNIYEEYFGNDSTVPKELFVAICGEFNIMMIDRVLEGKDFNMGHNLSTLSVIRIDRNPEKPVIDWGESNKYKQELLDEGTDLYNKDTGKGVKWHIYHTDGPYLKYYWRKGKCVVPNKSVYRFDATRGLKGNKGKLTQLLKEDDLAYLKFKKN